MNNTIPQNNRMSPGLITQLLMFNLLVYYISSSAMSGEVKGNILELLGTIKRRIKFCYVSISCSQTLLMYKDHEGLPIIGLSIT